MLSESTCGVSWDLKKECKHMRASILGTGLRANREQTGQILVADFFSHFCLFLYHGYLCNFFSVLCFCLLYMA